MDNIVLVALASISSATATYLFMRIKSGAEKIAEYQPIGAPGTGKLNLRKV